MSNKIAQEIYQTKWHILWRKSLRNKSGYNYHEQKLASLTYNKKFATKKGLPKRIQEEHNDLWWNYCCKMVRNKKEGDNDMNEACE